MRSQTDPFDQLERFFDRMSRQVGESADWWESEAPMGKWGTGTDTMAIDLVEHEGEFVLTADLPGFEKKDIDLQLMDEVLRISAEHEESTDEEGPNYLRHERRHSSANRSIRLPEQIDNEGVSAEMNHGVLTITLPKMEVDEATSIEIE